MTPTELRTERLRLRRWRARDLEPFAALNADPVVMEHHPARLTRDQSDALVARIEDSFERDGLGLWAAELLTSGEPIGCVGLLAATFEAHFTPAVEVGWRLAHRHWGHGYATEGARAAMGDGFERLELDEIVSFTATGNHRSRRVMERLGMTHDPGEDFDHPALPERHLLRRHVLYRRPDPA
ncbi:MAG: GNAT family N-acetyltransferase [Acidimicrobiales bacterium]